MHTEWTRTEAGLSEVLLEVSAKNEKWSTNRMNVQFSALCDVFDPERRDRRQTCD